MPLALDPNETMEIILNSDKDKPRESQPRFIYRFLTGREYRRVGALEEEISKKKTTGEACDSAYAAMKIGLVGWVNMFGPDGSEISFDPDRVEDVVGVVEVHEIIWKMMCQRPNIEDKKKFESQSATSTAESVKDVKEPESAKTNPRNIPPS